MTDTYDPAPEADGHREAKPSLLKGLFFILLIGAVATGLVFAALQLRSQEGPKVAAAAPKPISVSVMVAAPGESFQLAEKFTGLAEPRRTSMLGFSSGGRIQSIRADVGDRVAAGRTLARLDTRALNAQLASSQAVIEEARAAHALALNTVERQRTLMEKGHISQQRVDEAEAQADTAMARIEAAKAQAETLRVQIDLARITAPYAGVITKRMADEGAIAAPGSPIFELVESGKLEARIGVPAASAAKLETGKIYTLETDVGPVEAKLRAVTGVIETGQRTVTTVFDIPDAGEVPSGAVVRLGIDRTIDEQGVWVPVKALTAAARGLWTVYVAERNGDSWIAAQRPVEMIHSEGGRAYVRGTVTAGDQIIVDGLQRITPGQAVIPRDVTIATVQPEAG